MTTWLKDANGNKCSVEHWGSADAMADMAKLADAK